MKKAPEAATNGAFMQGHTTSISLYFGLFLTLMQGPDRPGVKFL